jgi:hypothetical protein
MSLMTKYKPCRPQMTEREPRRHLVANHHFMIRFGWKGQSWHTHRTNEPAMKQHQSLLHLHWQRSVLVDVSPSC